MYKAGDKVVCIGDISGFIKGKEYTLLYDPWSKAPQHYTHIDAKPEEYSLYLISEKDYYKWFTHITVYNNFRKPVTRRQHLPEWW